MKKDKKLSGKNNNREVYLKIELREAQEEKSRKRIQ